MILVTSSCDKGGKIASRGPEGDPVFQAKMRAAQEGAPKAQYELAWAYHCGLGTDQNFADAAVWYRKAAEQRHTKSAYYLGLLYKEGVGVAADEREGDKWLRKAAGDGDIEAMAVVGGYLIGRLDGESGRNRTAQVCIRESERGDPAAQMTLGYLFAYGIGVPIDYSLAYKWFGIAARSVEAPDRLNATVCQISFKKHLFSDELEEFEKVIGEWKPIKAKAD